MRRHDLSLRVAAPGALLLLGLVALGAVPAAAGVDSWTPFGPGQGRLVSVAASSRGDLYGVAAFDGFAEVWQLPAGATTWRWRNNGLGTPPLTAIAVHPTKPESLWAATAGPAAAIFRSSDAGATWLRVGAAPPELPIGRLYVVPLRESVVLFAEVGGGFTPWLMRSTDGGLTWTQVAGAWGPIAASTDRRGLLYARLPGFAGLVRSTDGGQTFQEVSIDVGRLDLLYAVHVTRGRKPLVFASFGGGLFRSTDGVRFERVGFHHNGPSAIASDPRDSRLVYVTDATAFYTSTRSGRAGSFRARAPVGFLGLPVPTAIVIGAVGPLFLSAGDLRGSAGGVAESGIAAFGVPEVRIAESDAAAVAVREYTDCDSSCDLRTFLSSDRGATFVRRGFQPFPRFFADTLDLAFDPASASRRLELSADLIGVVLVEPTGTSFLTPPVGNTLPTVVEIAAGGTLLVGAGGGALVSRDDGATWETALGNPGTFGPSTLIDLRADVGAADRVLALVVEAGSVDPPAPAKLLAYRSVDTAAHWTPVLPTLAGLLDVEPVPGSPTSLFALAAVAGGSELRRSDDGGVTSVPVHTFTIAEAVSDVAIDAVAPGVLYAASAKGVLRSRDGGITWESTPGTLGAWGPYRQRIQQLWVHPTERGHVFAAPAAGGLFENRLSD